MKSLLKIFSIFALTTTSVVTSIATISKSNTLDSDQYLSFGVDYDRPIQLNRDYNMAANIQAIIKSKNSKAPSQESLKRQFDELNSTYPLIYSVTKILNNYIYEKNYSYFAKYIKPNLGETESQKMFFQSAMFYSLSRGYPVMLYLNGSLLPWWEGNERDLVFITIYGASTENYDDTSLIEYEVVDPQGAANATAYLRANHLFRIFSQASCLWMEGNVFDFEKITTQFNVDVTTSSFNGVADMDYKNIVIRQGANIFKKGGIYSFEWIKRFVSQIIWNNSYIYYSWKTFVFKQPEQSWYFNKNSEDQMNWRKISEYSPKFTNWDEEMSIDTLLRYQYKPLVGGGNELLFYYKVSWNVSLEGGVPSRFPYIGISMGNSWTFQWD